MLQAITNLDLSILLEIQEHLRCGFSDVIFPVLSKLNNAGFIWIVITLVLLYRKKTRTAGLCMAVCLLVNLALGEGILKHLLNRAPPVCRTSHFTNADCAANDIFLSIRTYVLFVCCGNRSAAQSQTCGHGSICSRRSHFVFPPISVSALSDRCARGHPSGKLRRLVCHAMGMEKAEKTEKTFYQTIPHIITCTVDFRQCMFAFLDFYPCIWYTNTP